LCRSSVHIYARENREDVAVRVVGSSGWQAFIIYFISIRVGMWESDWRVLEGYSKGACYYIKVLFRRAENGQFHGKRIQGPFVGSHWLVLFTIYG